MTSTLSPVRLSCDLPCVCRRHVRVLLLTTTVASYVWAPVPQSPVRFVDPACELTSQENWEWRTSWRQCKTTVWSCSSVTFCAGRSVAANVQFVTDDLMPVAAPVTEISRTAISSHQSSYPSCTHGGKPLLLYWSDFRILSYIFNSGQWHCACGVWCRQICWTSSSSKIKARNQSVFL